MVYNVYMTTAETTKPETTTEKLESIKGKNLLLISSAAPTKRFIFQKLKSLGVKLTLLTPETTWASRYAETEITADTTDTSECISRIEEHLKDNKIDGVITFWEEAVPLCAKLRDKFGWQGHTYHTAINCRNKIRTRKALESAKLSHYSPSWSQIRTTKDLEKFARRNGYPFVLKPAWGENSQFVVRIDSIKEARDAFEYLKDNMTPSFNPIYRSGTEILAEGYMNGAEVDVDLLIQGGEIKFNAFTDNFPTKEPFFVETGDAMPSRHEDDAIERILDMAKDVVKGLAITDGAVHLEAKLEEDGPKVIEINARMGGDYLYDWIKSVWDVDIVEEAARIAVGLTCRPNSAEEPKIHLVGNYLTANYSGVITRLTGPAEESSDTKDIILLKEAGDAVLVPPEGFEAIGWVVGKGNTYAEAENALALARREVDFQISRFQSTSSIGKTRRTNRFNAAHVARGRILQSARVEKIRSLDPKSIKALRVGILCNKYDESAAGERESEAAVHSDLTSVGLNIQKALEKLGHKSFFFDMNETPLPFEKIASANLDLVFNVCERINNSSLLEPHGAAVLDCLGIPYTGSNPLTLALCIDKIKVKQLLDQYDLPTPKFDYVFSKEDEIDEDLRYPLMVKLANTDNSIGISNKSVVTNPKELKKQVGRLLDKYQRAVLIEEYIEGDEVDVTIMGNDERVKVLPLSRSIFDDLPPNVWHIYPFKAKWNNNTVYDKIRVERPAKYSQKLTTLISEICLDAYNVFDCHDYARIEVRVDKLGNPYIIEINPNPSININDCVPHCAEMTGLNYEEFIQEIMKEAILRYQEAPPYQHLQSSLSQV